MPISPGGHIRAPLIDEAEPIEHAETGLPRERRWGYIPEHLERNPDPIRSKTCSTVETARAVPGEDVDHDRSRDARDPRTRAPMSRGRAAAAPRRAAAVLGGRQQVRPPRRGRELS